MTRTTAEQTAQKLWDRTGKALPDIDDDAAMLELVKKAKGGDEVATAGIMLVLEKRVRRHGIFYGKAPNGRVTDAEVTGRQNHGQGGALSHLWIAIGNYDVDRHPTKVSYRLTKEVEYLCRAPSRLANVIDVQVFGHISSGDFGQLFGSADGGFGDVDAEVWLEEVLDANDIPEVRREIARALFEAPMTDRELAAKLDVPFGSMSRHSQALRRDLAELRGELVA